MRRRAAALSVLLLLATGALAACGDDAGQTEPTATTSESGDTTTEAATSAEDLAALEGVEITGDLGATPTLTLADAVSFGTPVARVVEEGTGEQTPVGEDLIEVNYAVFSGDDASLIGSTWDTDAPEAISLASLDTLFASLVEAVTSTPTGSRVAFAIPGTAAAEGVEATPANIMVLEVLQVLPRQATGTPVAPVEGLPTVTLTEDGTPSITVPEGYDSAELVAQPLIEGDGDVVESGQFVTVQYSGWLLDGTQFDSSWANGAVFQTAIGVGSVVEGWDTGLVGQTVGSQVLLVIPAELGYGAEEAGAIPANSTLVFVVDILHAG